MEQIDISTAMIVKLILSGIFVYLVAPILLVLRDMMLLKVIEKWILTSSLNADIRLCESDRWYLDNKYQKERSIQMPVSGGEPRYIIDDDKVSKDKYDLYESNLKMHQNRFYLLDSKLNYRHNLIFWLTKHYKQDDGFKSPINTWRKEAYLDAESRYES